MVRQHNSIFRGFLTASGQAWSWIALSLMVLLLDYLAGPLILFPFLFIVPVGLASWHGGVKWGLPLSLVLPPVRWWVEYLEGGPWSVAQATTNAIIQSIVLAGYAYLLNRQARQTRELEKEVRVLEGILPICAHCKSIRDDGNQWQSMEHYISSRSEAKFTHSICPECTRKLYPDLIT